MRPQFRTKLTKLDSKIPDFTLPADIDQRIDTQAELSSDLYDWTLQTRFLKGEPFTFESRPYLEQPYRDDAKGLAIVKGRQTEVSEYDANWLLKMLSQHENTVGLYISDRFSHTKVFSNLRVRDYCLKASPILNQLAPWENHTVHQLPFSNGSILYFHSAYGGFDEARSLPLDFGVVDEIENTQVSELDVFLAALDHSKYGFYRLTGTGSDEGSKWHDTWMDGTQYHWKGDHWEAKNPGADLHSYWIPQEITPWYDHKRAMAVKRRNMRRYITEIYGWWYKGKKLPLTEQIMQKLFIPHITMVPAKQVVRELGPITIGLDWGGGNTAHTVIWVDQWIDTRFDISQCLYCARIDDKSVERQARKVIDLVKLYNPDQAVMDAAGGAHQMQSVENAFAWQVVKQYYGEHPNEPIIEKDLISKNTLNVDRTYSIEQVIAAATEPVVSDIDPLTAAFSIMKFTGEYIPRKSRMRIILPGANAEELEWIIDDFKNTQAKNVTLATGREYIRYIKVDENEPNDALMAKGYSNSAYYLWKKRANLAGDLQGLDI